MIRSKRRENKRKERKRLASLRSRQESIRKAIK